MHSISIRTVSPMMQSSAIPIMPFGILILELLVAHTTTAIILRQLENLIMWLTDDDDDDEHKSTKDNVKSLSTGTHAFSPAHVAKSDLSPKQKGKRHANKQSSSPIPLLETPMGGTNCTVM